VTNDGATVVLVVAAVVEVVVAAMVVVVVVDAGADVVLVAGTVVFAVEVDDSRTDVETSPPVDVGCVAGRESDEQPTTTCDATRRPSNHDRELIAASSFNSA
jgi:hypothetical protein